MGPAIRLGHPRGARGHFGRCSRVTWEAHPPAGLQTLRPCQGESTATKWGRLDRFHLAKHDMSVSGVLDDLGMAWPREWNLQPPSPRGWWPSRGHRTTVGAPWVAIHPPRLHSTRFLGPMDGPRHPPWPSKGCARPLWAVLPGDLGGAPARGLADSEAMPGRVHCHKMGPIGSISLGQTRHERFRRPGRLGHGMAARMEFAAPEPAGLVAKPGTQNNSGSPLGCHTPPRAPFHPVPGAHGWAPPSALAIQGVREATLGGAPG